MNKKILVTLVFITSIGITIAQEMSLEKAKTDAREALIQAKLVSKKLKPKLTKIRSYKCKMELTTAFELLAETTTDALNALDIHEINDPVIAQNITIKTKNATQEIEETINSIQEANIPKMAADANDLAYAIEQMAKATHSTTGTIAVKAVRNAAEDIQAIVRR